MKIFGNKVNQHLGTIDRDSLQRLTPEQLKEVLRDPRPPHFWDYQGKFEGYKIAWRKFSAATGEAGQNHFFPFKNSKGELYPSVDMEIIDTPAEEKAVLRVHSQKYLQMLKELSAKAESQEIPLVFEGNIEAHISPGTYRTALTAAGASLEALKYVMEGDGRTAFANVWPPGHHAESSRHGREDLALGFCYLSNAAIVALEARDNSPRVSSERANRVLVIDIDNHYGNGTRTALVDEKDILVVDFVQRSPFENGRYLDGVRDPDSGTVTDACTEFPPVHTDDSIPVTAHPVVKGSNIIELEFFKRKTEGFTDKEAPETGILAAATPEEIIEAFISKALPKIKEFKPDVVIWSAGIDSAQNDRVGGMGLVPGAVYTLIRGMRLVSEKHIALAEGGYHQSNFFPFMAAIGAALHGDPRDTKDHSRLFAKYKRFF